MCVICYAPAGATPTEDQLTNSTLSNPDGFGWMVRTADNKIVTGRTMDAANGIDRFLDLRVKHPDQDAAFHARITTHGKTMIDNNHPFRVGDKRTVLMHNGMLPIDVPKGDDRSDTRLFAEDRLTKMGLGILDNKKERKALQKWMQGSKMVIMTSRADLKQSTYILNENAGHWENGIWWSNSSYEDKPTYTWPSKYSWERYTGDPYADLDGDQCMNPDCGINWTVTSDSAIKGVCQACYRCLDCGHDEIECLCYGPGSAWRKTDYRWSRQ